ncbi:VWA domain-containing protein [Haloarcula sp. S1AR25-5A]|uniref:VWA domain-containing protein n=1 Tax=Haloarcula terrestris TaxID=2950533 RepID=A0AAE4JHS0_9EURY|nr:VWA domain-containing protein [Haloarcula terrestris]MDS0222978.1 VWA domain-containing protein [Haloarcula terrestris]
MVLSDVLLAPLGLAALLLAVPIVLLYLIRPDPQELALPTFQFLVAEERQQSATPFLERISRSLLLLLQVLVVLVLAVGLASPYVTVSERATVEETVIVVDTSASMGTDADGQTRFQRAVAAAREEVTGTTSIVTTTDGGEVILQRGTPTAARGTLDGLSPTDTPGELSGAISQAASIAGENARIVVLSDFAGEEWTTAVTTARGRGLSVDLQQFNGGGDGNVGFIDRRFSGSSVTLSVKNYGDSSVTRTVRLGNTQQEMQLGPDDVGSVTMPVPAGGSEAQLSPGDSFATDDSVYVAAPEDTAVDVLVLTNDRNRYLITALSVVDRVNVTVKQPPTTIQDGYDVILYSNVEQSSLLPGNVESGRELVEEGGGVAVLAQDELPQRYQNLLLIEPGEIRTGATVGQTQQTQLTRGIDFQPPDEYVSGSLRSGSAQVQLGDGTPLIATEERNGGRIMYYGYIEDRSSFKFNYQYPVFWKRAVYYLADREQLPALNHETGETVRFGNTTVEGPAGSVSGNTVSLQRAGFYRTESRQVSASLLDEGESSTNVDPLDQRSGTAGNLTRTERRSVPQPLTEYFALAGLVLALVEVGYLRRRGDL